jgi:hypothetical protein
MNKKVVIIKGITGVKNEIIKVVKTANFVFKIVVNVSTILFVWVIKAKFSILFFKKNNII